MNRSKLIEELNKWEEDVEVNILVDLTRVVGFSNTNEETIMLEISDVEEDNAESRCILFTGYGDRSAAYYSWWQNLIYRLTGYMIHPSIGIAKKP